MQAIHDTSKPGETSPMLARLAKVVRMIGLGRTTVYRMIAKKQFPGPVCLADRAAAWRYIDLAAWIESRAAAH